MPEPSFLDELKSYIGFTLDDARALAAFRPIAAPAFPGIADEFYALIRMHEGALAVLRDEEQARRLHASLQRWLDELLSGPWDASYLARHVRIGEVHVRVGLPQHYMVTAMSRVRASLVALAGAAYRDNPAARAACAAAVERVCDVDLGIMLEGYKRDLAARIERVRALERATLETQLAARKRFLAEVFDIAEVAILGFHPDGNLVFWNRKAEGLTGYAADEILGTDPFQRLFGERAADVRPRLLSAKPTASLEMEEPMLTRSGKERRVRWHAAVGNVDGPENPIVVVVAFDVTDEREVERRARQTERLAATGRLAAGLAHEIRNPLNGASLHLSVLERALPGAVATSADARLAVDVVRTELRRLSDLVTDFLDVSRPRALMLTDGNLNALAQSVALLLAPEAATRKVSLLVEPFPLPVVGRFDGERMKQVLLNLARNALEAVAIGGKITLRVRRTAHSLEMDVEDDGAGIPDPKTPIFDAFYTTKDAGTGLGLSIVQGIVLDHGGDIQFTSRPGKTLFTVRLPG